MSDKSAFQHSLTLFDLCLFVYQTWLWESLPSYSLVFKRQITLVLPFSSPILISITRVLKNYKLWGLADDWNWSVGGILMSTLQAWSNGLRRSPATFLKSWRHHQKILTKVNKKHGLLFHVRMTNDLPLCFVCGWLDDQGP